MKSTRHSRILDIISKKEIETQEELVAELIASGFKVIRCFPLLLQTILSL